MKNFLILGATSAIAQAFCRQVAPRDARFWIVGRNPSRLQSVAADLLARGAASAECAIFATGDYTALQTALAAGFAHLGPVDVFLAAQGILPDHAACEADPSALTELLTVNTLELMQASLLVATRFEQQGHGRLVLLGSVAGDRGRLNNYLYGTTKAALDPFCEGLRQRLEPAIQVLLVKPGPVDSPMTAHLAKSPLFTTPEKVAADILRALRSRRGLLYSPFFWRWIMAIIRLLPRRIVKRLKA